MTEFAWFIEGFPDDTRRVRRVSIARSPFRVGRGARMDLQLLATSVSQHHADLAPSKGGLRVVDLESTNGTFLNGVRISEPALATEGDIVHFADLEWRVGRLTPEETKILLGSTETVGAPLPTLVIERARLLQELIEQGDIAPVFQPIVEIASGARFAYEVLARADLGDTDDDGAARIFQLAGVLDAESLLSQVARERGVALGRSLTPSRLFINTHPKEIANRTDLFTSLVAAQESAPELEIVVELHESALADLPAVRDMRDELHGLGMKLAFDDFGVGQSRLAELTSAPPDYLKIDRSLVVALIEPGMARQVLASIGQAARDNDIHVIAEGIETKDQAARCEDFGIELAQGYFFARPAPATVWSGP